MDSLRARIRQHVHLKNPRVREFLAELLGTLFLVLLGDGSVAQWTFQKTSGSDSGSFLSVNWGFAFAIAFGVYISAGVSGGHINPAISLSQFLLGNITVIQLGIYIVAQVIGAFFGAALIFVAYIEKLNALDKHRTIRTVGIFGTFPGPHLSPWGGLFDQMLGAGILSLCVLALTDKRNTDVPKAAVPLLVGFCVGVVGMSFGYNCGFAINPARDFGPRLFTLVAGWKNAFYDERLGYNWFWVPIVGPLLGACLGAWMYKLFVGLHWPEEEVMVLNGQEVVRAEQTTTTEVVYVTKKSHEDA